MTIFNLKEIFKGNHPEFNKIIQNTFWLFFDKFIRILSGLFVGLWVARYLGPEQFGLLSFAIAFVSLFSAIAALGIDSIVTREIVRNSFEKSEILGTAFFLKLTGGFIALLLAIITINIIRPDDYYSIMLVLIIGIGILFQSADVIDYWFRSQVLSKYTVIAKIGPLILTTILKIYLILTHAPLLAFALTVLGEMALNALGLAVIYTLQGDSIKSWIKKFSVAKLLLKEGWPLMLAYLSFMIYTRIDQVMIGSMLSDSAVGIYSISVRLLEILLSIYLMITSSLFPGLTKLYYKNKDFFFIRHYQITFLYTISSLIILICVYFLGENIIILFLGEEYSGSYKILTIHLVGLLFMANAGLRSTYLTISSNQRIIMITTFFASIFNVLMNYVLIPFYGEIGAALATVLTQIISLLILNVLFQETKKIFINQLKSLFLIPPKFSLLNTKK